MIRSILIAGACVGALALSAAAQVRAPVQLPEEARRVVNAPALAQITPAARASIAARLVGRTIPITAISITATVTPRAPVFGPDSAAVLTLSARSATWNTTRGSSAPNIAIGPSADARSGPAIVLDFAAEAATRYLVLCDMEREGRNARAILGVDRDAPITWETPTRAALLIPPQTAAGNVRLTFRQQSSSAPGGGVELQRCEISAIRM
jgi:hypothetical protein